MELEMTFTLANEISAMSLARFLANRVPDDWLTREKNIVTLTYQTDDERFKNDEFEIILKLAKKTDEYMQNIREI